MHKRRLTVEISLFRRVDDPRSHPRHGSVLSTVGLLSGLDQRLVLVAGDQPPRAHVRDALRSEEDLVLFHDRTPKELM